MLTRKTKLNKKIMIQAIALAFGNCTLMSLVHAQETVTTQKVEVTGSSIKRVASEGALPVQTITAEMIERSGATSMPELLQSLPIMQDVWTKSAGVGAAGVGNGIQNANLHGIGSNYTLTLVNGRRMAAFGGGGNSSDLNSIPLSAIERVEILTDGASAIYGSDAIGGVINFILKKNATFKTVEANINRPTQGVNGTTKRLSATLGFGDIGENKYNVIVGFSANDTTALDAKDRKFSNSGIRPLTINGKPYALVDSNTNSSPSNVTVNKKDKTPSVTFNPNLLATGACPVDGNIAVGDVCRFDFAHVVQLQGPEKEHKFFTTMNFDLGDDRNLYVDAWVSKNVQTPEYAPPAGSRTLTVGSPLYNKYVLPNLQRYGIDPANVRSTSYTYRLMDAGRRGVETEANARHLALGLQGNALGWDYDVSYTNSQSLRINNWTTGFLYGSKYNAIVASGQFDPFAVPTSNSKALMAPAVIQAEWYRNRGTNSIFNARASRALFNLDGGSSMISVGGEHYTRTFVYTPSALGMGANSLQPDYAETIVGGSQGLLPTDAKRKTYAFFSELFLPVKKNWEVTGALRFDHADKIYSRKIFDPDGKLLAPGEVGKAYSGITYKLSTAFRPTSNLLLRASFGSSFSAPSLYDITTKLEYQGTLSTEYPCPVTQGPLLPYCEGKASYGYFTGGNSSAGENGLKAERARQFTAGFRYEPDNQFSFGFDWYKIKIRDQILTLSSADVYTNPERYQDLFRTYYDRDEEKTLIAAQLVKTNRYNSLMQGIDWDHSFKTKTPLGALKLSWTGTYAINNEYQLPNKAAVGQIANADEGGSGILRWSSMLTATLYASNVWSHTLSMKNTSGYHDYSYSKDDKMVLEVLPNGTYGNAIDYKRDVGRATLFNWQTRAVLNKNLTVSLGIKNIFNRDPLFSMVTAGDSRGFNALLASPLGRQINLVGKYTF